MKEKKFEAPLMKEKEEAWHMADNDPDFLRFLVFCAKRLEQGQTVQEIWSAWNEEKCGKGLILID